MRIPPKTIRMFLVGLVLSVISLATFLLLGVDFEMFVVGFALGASLGLVIATIVFAVIVYGVTRRR